MALYQLKTSFAGGELSDAMYGRVDINKYDSGAALLKNFIVQRYGGARNRNGFMHVAKTYGGKRAYLIPFSYNDSDTCMVEVTAGHCRFFVEGKPLLNIDGVPYTITNNLVDSDLEGVCKLKYTQSADILFIVHPNHAPMTLTRYSNLNWVWEDMAISGGPFDDPLSNIKITPSGTTGNVTLSASASVFKSVHVGSFLKLSHYIKSEYAKGVPNSSGTGLVVNCLPGSTVYVESFGFWKGNFQLEKYDTDSASWVLVRRQEGNHSQNYNFTETNNEDHIVKYRILSTEFDTTIWSGENEKQTGFVTIQSFGNDYDGIVKITSVSSATVAAGTVIRTLGAASASNAYAFSPWNSENGYPSAVGFYEDRLVFAGSKKGPMTFWSSKSGDYYNFGTSVPQVDDDAVTATLNGSKMNGIRAMIAFGELILLTAGGEYKVSGNGKAIAPTNVVSQAQEYRGISFVPPATVGSRIVYVQQQGNIIRDLAYSYEADKYTGDDLNLLCSHLFDNHKIVGMAYQQVPDSIIWFVRDDGLLLGMTYIKEQDIYAWHRHTMKDSAFVNVGVVSGSVEDDLYGVIERDGVHYIVMAAHRNDNSLVKDQFYVDDGITVKDADIKTVTGLDWLEGKEVAILADGNVLPSATVAGGSITVGTNHGYSTVTVGLPIDAEIKSLPIEFNAQDGSYMSRKKRITAMSILFKNSRGGLYGMNEKRLDEIKWRTNEPWGEPINLFTGKKKLTVPSANWEETRQITIRQDSPLPMTVLAIVPEIEAGG